MSVTAVMNVVVTETPGSGVCHRRALRHGDREGAGVMVVVKPRELLARQ